MFYFLVFSFALYWVSLEYTFLMLRLRVQLFSPDFCPVILRMVKHDERLFHFVRCLLFLLLVVVRGCFIELQIYHFLKISKLFYRYMVLKEDY